MCLDKLNEKEKCAIDSLIVASLRAAEQKDEITEEEIQTLYSEGLNLSKEEKNKIESLGNDFFSIEKNNNSNDNLNAKLKKELDEKRNEIKKNIKKKKDDSDNK